MVFIPLWITNILLLITCWLAGFQLVKMQRPNPVTNIQFVMIVFCMLLVLVIVMNRITDPWLSFGVFVIAASCLGTMIRQHRMLPPSKPFE